MLSPALLAGTMAGQWGGICLRMALKAGTNALRQVAAALPIVLSSQLQAKHNFLPFARNGLVFKALPRGASVQIHTTMLG
jgi:hypothetical protein